MNKKILVIASHPDDETLGMGGTILKHTSKENIVHVLVITDGSSSQYKNYEKMIKRKKDEAKKSMNILGVKKIEFNTLPDMKLDMIPQIEINKVIEKKIKDFKPDIVYTHHGGDINKDHRIVFESTMVALRPKPNQKVNEIYTYETPSSTEWGIYDEKNIFKSNVFEDISNFVERKIKAVKSYKTELREYPHPRSPEAIKAYDKRNGITVGKEFVERFYLIRSMK